MRAVLFLLMLCCLPGCATLWTVLEVTDADWQQGESSTEAPAGPVERRLKVSAAYREPVLAPVVAAPEVSPPALLAPPPPPSPGVITVAPRPGPPPSPGSTVEPALVAPRGALGVNCLTEERFSRVHVRKELYRYDGVWKALTAFFFVAEAAFSSLIIYSSTKDQVEPAPVVIGAVVGLDALGTAILFWHPPQTVVRHYDADGTWQHPTEGCPAGLAVETGEGRAPVAPDGTVGDVGGWMLGTALWAPDTTFSLRLGDGPAHQLDPSRDERCGWATQAGASRPWCKSTRLTGTKAQLTLPLDAPVQ